MKQLDHIEVFSVLFFAWIWQIFLFYECDNIGADLTKEALTFLITLWFHLSSDDILRPASWGCLLRRFLRPLL